MKRFLTALLLVVFLLLPATAYAAEEPAIASCEIVNISGPIAYIQCVDALGNIIPAGQVDLPEVIKQVDVLVPGPTVTLPPLPPATVTLPPAPIVTQFIPGPTETVTDTVRVPGPTATTTVSEPSGTETIYLQSPTETVTKTPEAIPAPTVTETVTNTVTKEVEVDKPQPDGVLFDPPPLTVPGAVGYSVLALLLMCGLILLGLWLGYILGYKDSEREERKFLEALRDQFSKG